MSQNHRVILVGNTILMAGFAASLATYPDIELVRVDPLGTENTAIFATQPNPLVFYDMSIEMPVGFLTVLRRVQGLVLIGLDPNCEFAWVLSSSITPAMQVQDLADAIRSNNFLAGCP